MDPELPRVIARILSFHVGKSEKLSMSEIIDRVVQRGGKQLPKHFDRQVREVIHGLRLAGIPICSSSGLGGYWVAAPGTTELSEFLGEVMSRATSLFAVNSALKNCPENVSGEQTSFEFMDAELRNTGAFAGG